mmetsp:Transcript_19134/g.60195  ORF Transcript_19134/g.60195 Transcript_19134/m.60195 type:complete len:382 (-) Transcript_19134:33-1178(-)
MVVDIMVPTGVRNSDDGVDPHGQAGPVVLCNVHHARDLCTDGHDVDALAVVPIERASRDGLDPVHVGKELGLRHGYLAGLLLAEDPSLHGDLPALRQEGVVHDVVAEHDGLALLAGNGDVLVPFVCGMQDQRATAAADEVEHGHLPTMIEGKVALEHAGPDGVAACLLKEVHLLIGTDAVHVEHAIAPAHAVEPQVGRYVADAGRQVRELPVCHLQASRIVEALLVLQGQVRATKLEFGGLVGVPMRLLAVRPLAHVHDLELRHEADPVLQDFGLPRCQLAVRLLVRHLHDAVLLLPQHRGKVGLELRGPALRAGEGQVEATLRDWRGVVHAQVLRVYGHQLAIEGLNYVLPLLIHPNQGLALLAVDMDRLCMCIQLKCCR